MSDPFLAEIRIFTGNFAPKGWALCNGQLMPISQNTALFSLLGTTYGGNGTSNFALPNLQGCAPMHPGQGPGLSLHDLGETAGEQNVTLLQTEMPQHSHVVNCESGAGNSLTPASNSWSATIGIGRGAAPADYAPAGNGVGMSPLATSIAGSGLPHNNMQPFLGLTFIIALQGIFPARS